MHNLITKLHTPIFKPKQIALSILLVLTAFFATWGAGLQQISSFDLSKIFPSLAVLLIFYWALFVRHKIRSFPPIFNYFMLFFILHTIVTYAILLPSEFTFGITQEFQLQGGFVNFHQGNGMAIARFLLFALYAYAIASLLRTEKMLIAFALAYGAGLTIVMMLGGYRVISGEISDLRLSAGFLNPNLFGTSALMCIFLNLFVLIKRGLIKSTKIFAIGFIIIGILGILLSGSRSCLLGLIVGLFILLIYVPKIKIKIKLIAGFVIIISLLLCFVPQYVRDNLEVRMNILEKIESDGIGSANVRFAIWRDYAKELPKYFFTGIGFHRSKEATKKSFNTRINYYLHNRYLHTLVEFGFIGFLLFLGGLRQLWKRISCYSWQIKISITDSVILGFFSAWLVMMMFRSYSGSRDLWIFLGIIAGYGTMKTKVRQNNLLKKNICSNNCDRSKLKSDIS